MSNSMTKAERLEYLKEAHTRVMKRKAQAERELERWMPSNDFFMDEGLLDDAPIHAYEIQVSYR